jgi:serine/threonine protein kinase
MDGTLLVSMFTHASSCPPPADFSTAVRSPPGTPKRSDPAGVIYWQVRPSVFRGCDPSFITHRLSKNRDFFPFSPFRLQKCERKPFFFLYPDRIGGAEGFYLFIDSGLYDPLKVDVWSLGATTWEVVHGDPPFSDVQDTPRVCGTQLPPVRQHDAYSRSFHDFLHLCSQPAASRPDPDELLNVRCFFLSWLVTC